MTPCFKSLPIDLIFTNSNLLSDWLTDKMTECLCLVTESPDLTLPIAYHASGHNPEPTQSNSHLQNLLRSIFMLSSYNHFSVHCFQRGFSNKILFACILCFLVIRVSYLQNFKFLVYAVIFPPVQCLYEPSRLHQSYLFSATFNMN